MRPNDILLVEAQLHAVYVDYALMCLAALAIFALALAVLVVRDWFRARVARWNPAAHRRVVLDRLNAAAARPSAHPFPFR